MQALTSPPAAVRRCDCAPSSPGRMQALAPHAAVRCCRRASRRASVAVASVKSVRKDVLAGEKYRETFQVSLLGLGGKATEQVLTAGPGTVLVPLLIARPLGIVFEERRLALNAAPVCIVDEVAPGSNAEKAGVLVGDVLRLVSAVVEYREKVDVMAYYMQPPAARNRRALLVADGQPFAKVMKAIISNSQEVDMPDNTKKVFDEVPIVLERAVAGAAS